MDAYKATHRSRQSGCESPVVCADGRSVEAEDRIGLMGEVVGEDSIGACMHNADEMRVRAGCGGMEFGI